MRVTRLQVGPGPQCQRDPVGVARCRCGQQSVAGPSSSLSVSGICEVVAGGAKQLCDGVEFLAFASIHRGVHTDAQVTAAAGLAELAARATVLGYGGWLVVRG